MNKFDKYIRKKASSEYIETPKEVSNKIDEILNDLPEKKGKINYIPRVAFALACIIIVVIIVLPNVSDAYAKEISKIPGIGKLVKVVTIKNYFYRDNINEMEIDVPKIEEKDNKNISYINKEVDKFTSIIKKQFYKDIDEKGNHVSVKVKHSVITNDDNWFTLKLSVLEVSASSNSYYKYYHIDKKTGNIVYLEDLFIDESYSDVITDDIKRQMKEEMKKDSNKMYWIEEDLVGEVFSSVNAKHNFYFDKKGRLVIPFAQYEVAPGYMGSPKFIINKSVIKDILKKEYKEIIEK